MNKKINKNNINQNNDMYCDISNSNQCNSKDIHLQNISINTHNKILFKETDLKIIYGNHYGLIGKNGIGKTSLLKHIAYRKLPI